MGRGGRHGSIRVPVVRGGLIGRFLGDGFGDAFGEVVEPPHHFEQTALELIDLGAVGVAAEQALAKVAEAARQQGYGLLIFDCYRPQRAVNHFMRWSQQPEDFSTQPSFYPNEQKHLLFERGYIAERSGHSRGATVDLGLYRLSSGEPVDFGTAFDFMDPASATDYKQLAASAVAHRQLLVALMTQHGFTNYAQEWWHYTFKPEPFPDTYFDIPVH